VGAGESGWVQLRLEEPVLARARDHLVIRTYSPVTTLGGGRVVEVHPRKWRRLAAGEGELPNFVVIFTDDQGYQDVGCFGSPLIKTPHLDRMATEGTRFTDFYVGAPICSLPMKSIKMALWALA